MKTLGILYFILALLVAHSSVEVVSPSSRDGGIEMVTTFLPSWMIDSEPEVLKRNANITVTKDGTGDYNTVTEAVAAVPRSRAGRFVIYVKLGVYNENIRVKTENLTIIGDGMDNTILTSSLSQKDGFSIITSATLGIDGAGFIAMDICIRNTAGAQKGQAVALRVSGDESVIYRCRVDGFQDSLFAQKGKQFYRETHILGTIDFICGDATAVFQNCLIEARRPLLGQANVLTAQARTDPNGPTGFSFQNCDIKASPDLEPFKKDVKTFLGRPWMNYSRVVFMQSVLGDHIDPAGWAVWNDDPKRLSTLYYGEYQNRGPGANTSGRVKWKGYRVITDPNEAANFTVSKFLGQLWINSTGVPYDAGL